MSRTVSWFSCGAASAVATKLAIASGIPVIVAYCEIAEEHQDNKRFLRDCEEWFGQEVIVLGNDKYNRSIYDVFKKTRYLKGPGGARCTGELKKNVRKAFEQTDDKQVFGYTSDEVGRLDRFIDANNDVDIWPILIEKGLTKDDCMAIIDRAGIELPEMYKLGYRNNNCIGCVKGEAGYWNKIRIDFPDVFDRMSRMEDYLGRTVCKVEKTENGKRTLERIRLVDLPVDQGNYDSEIDVQCGIFCYMAEQDIDSQQLRDEVGI
jgi:hypothetical protein